MLIFCNLNRASIYNELVMLDLIPKPEKMTEHYFSDHTHLPGAATSNQEISFAFSIHNVETTDYQHVYEVSVNANSQSTSSMVGRYWLKTTNTMSKPSDSIF